MTLAPETATVAPALDHEERSRITRHHVLDAAVAVLVEEGYSGASTLRIQQKANVSRGRLLHQYPNRDLLLVAAAQHLAENRVRAAGQAREWPAERTDRLRAAVGAMWDTYHDLQGYFWAATELWLAARHNASLAQALAPGERSIGRQVRASTDGLFGEEIS
ncbi:MAG: TetR/AcrR family transcriptional regulator, partial [Actinomycetales bacterium]